MREGEQLKRDMQNFINKGKYRMYISNIQQMNGNSIEFSLSTQTRRVIKSSQAKSLHNTWAWYCASTINP